tara:strand:- start:233 stop:469 length:237 start_codon:yes stop_codon:yes gene_type:complete
MPVKVRESGQWVEVSGVGAGVTNVIVTQTSYTGTNPITVTNGSNIGIGSISNAYGTRWIQTYTPTTEGNDGDVWYQIT